MPQVSRSPKRKRVRRYFSASAATGARWNPKFHGLQAASTSSTKRRRRSSSVSSNETYDFSPNHPHEEFHSEDESTFRYTEVSNPFGTCDNRSPSLDQSRPPLTYASLPPTPISPSPPLQPSSPLSAPLPSFPSLDSVHEPPFSIWDYLREELLATDFDSHQELKWERVSNFLSMPIALEKVSCILLAQLYPSLTVMVNKIFLFGFIVCLDSFMYTFTILPIRFALAFWRLLLNTFSRSSPPLPPSQKADILRAMLLVVSIVILAPLTDASKLYHFIRGQDTIKLYVIFNALEVRLRLVAYISVRFPRLTHYGDPCVDSRSSLRLNRPRHHRLSVLSVHPRGHLSSQTAHLAHSPAVLLFSAGRRVHWSVNESFIYATRLRYLQLHTPL